jgi:hypothetical protein
MLVAKNKLRLANKEVLMANGEVLVVNRGMLVADKGMLVASREVLVANKRIRKESGYVCTTHHGLLPEQHRIFAHPDLNAEDHVLPHVATYLTNHG